MTDVWCCTKCHHPWHGLSCTVKGMNEDTRVTEACACPSQFTEAHADEGDRER